MSNPKHHHYIPVTYLKRFCKNDKIWVYDAKTDNYYEQPPKTVFRIKNYYSFESETALRDVCIEDFFGRLENDASLVLDKIASKGKLDNDDKSTIAYYIAYQMVRIPKFRKNYEEFILSVEKKRLFLSTATRERAKASLESIPNKKFKVTDEIIDSLVDATKKDEFDFKVDKNYSLWLMLDLGRNLGKYFYMMDWFLFYTNQKHSFISCDSPLMIQPPSNFPKHPFIKPGVLTPGAIKFFPLSSSTCLAMGDLGEIIKGTFPPPKLIRYINQKIALNSKRFIFGKDIELLKRIVNSLRKK